MSTKTTWAGFSHSLMMLVVGAALGITSLFAFDAYKAHSHDHKMSHDHEKQEAKGNPSADAEVSRNPEVKLLRVVDGDTVWVSLAGQEVKLRLLRIDTPEQNEPGYKEATEALKDLLEGKQLRLEYEIPGKRAKGNHGRDLVYLWAKDEKGEMNVNLEMVKRGWTAFYRKYGDGKYAELFKEAEKRAMEELRGLWKR